MQGIDGQLMRLELIPSTHIDKAWRDGAHMLSESCKASNEITADQLKMMLSRGERSLFVGVILGKPVGWMVVDVDQLPNVRVLHVHQLYAPENMHDEFFEQLKAIAVQQGCSEVRCSAQPAQARLYRARFGFEPVYETLRVSL